jgi:hypothetical protein
MPFSQQIKNIIDAIFSDSGYNIQKFNIKFPTILDINISKLNNGVELSFKKDLPKITWKKFITLSARVSGIVLNDNGGILKLKYFPDIHFSYNESEERFGMDYDLSSIEYQIEEEYSEPETRFLAKKCLQYAHEWATIASQGCDLKCSNRYETYKLKKGCKKFVIENIKNDPEIKSGSLLLSFLFFYIAYISFLVFCFSSY